jgi:hypothetical protein
VGPAAPPPPFRRTDRGAVEQVSSMIESEMENGFPYFKTFSIDGIQE